MLTRLRGAYRRWRERRARIRELDRVGKEFRKFGEACMEANKPLIAWLEAHEKARKQ